MGAGIGKTIISGNDSLCCAFDGGSRSDTDVTVSDLTLEHWWIAGARLGTRWNLQRVESRYNLGCRISAPGTACQGTGYGIKSVGADTWVRDSWIHHNGNIGYGPNGAVRGGLTGSDISFNNTNRSDPCCSGGSKLWNTDGQRLSGNRWHENYGNGLWLDGNNRNFTINGDTADKNDLRGFFIEISCFGTLQNSTASDNRGHPDIDVQTSHDILVQNNRVVHTVAGVVSGIRVIDANRTGSGYCTNSSGRWTAANVRVLDNDITMADTTDYNGYVRASATAGSVAGAQWDRNHYHVPTIVAQWKWFNGSVNQSETYLHWVATGHDLNGTCAYF
jgi:parallel beta-helix repeat protein